MQHPAHRQKYYNVKSKIAQGLSTRYGCYGFGRTTFYSIYPCMANLCILFHDIAIQFKHAVNYELLYQKDRYSLIEQSNTLLEQSNTPIK